LSAEEKPEEPRGITHNIDGEDHRCFNLVEYKNIAKAFELIPVQAAKLRLFEQEIGQLELKINLEESKSDIWKAHAEDLELTLKAQQKITKKEKLKIGLLWAYNGILTAAVIFMGVYNGIK